MTEQISKELIQSGLETGAIRFRMEQNLLAAVIGDHWFYKGSSIVMKHRPKSLYRLIKRQCKAHEFKKEDETCS